MDQIKLSTWVIPLVAINVEHSIVKEDQFLAIFDMSIDFFRCVILECSVAYGFRDMPERELVSYAI